MDAGGASRVPPVGATLSARGLWAKLDYRLHRVWARVGDSLVQQRPNIANEIIGCLAPIGIGIDSDTDPDNEPAWVFVVLWRRGTSGLHNPDQAAVRQSNSKCTPA